MRALRSAFVVSRSRPSDLNTVLIVGYQLRKDADGKTRTFFKFKNSWGEQWGERGYGYMSSEYLRAYGVSGEMIAPVGE